MADVEPPIRAAATVILVRDAATRPAILMGQRGQSAAFMPSKFVFPGGAVDDTDAMVPLAGDPDPLTASCLAEASAGPAPKAIIAAAVRELWEETGLRLGEPAVWHDPPRDWIDFASTGLRPSGRSLSFVFRAITPPGRPRRFDARFLLADAAAIVGDANDFSRASDELSQLSWIPIEDARRYDLPFITEVVLAEVTARLPDLSTPPTVPFFKNDDEESLLLRLGRS